MRKRIIPERKGDDVLTFLREIITNKSIMVPVLGWFIAQFFKVAGIVVKEKKLDFKKFVSAGGMPSSHSAFVVSLAAVVGKNNGWDSHLFGISCAVAVVVMYDAAGIRRAAGNQAKVLNTIIFNSGMHFDEKLKELLGHSPFEVVIGAILGIVLGLGLG